MGHMWSEKNSARAERNARVPNTIGRQKAADLRNRGAKNDWFSKKAVAQRKASEKQRSKSRWN